MSKKGLPLFIILIVSGFLLVGFIVWFFLIGSVPINYADCLKFYPKDAIIDELSCAFSPRTPAEYKICEQKNGIINQFKQCLIIYYNPAFEFPKNLEECGRKTGVYMNETTCDIQVGNKGAYDEAIVNNLIERCLQNGGQKMSDGSCWIRFTPQGIKF